MTKIDRDLISNKPSCYIFDIDGCLADVHEILLTKEQTYKIKQDKYNHDKEQYNYWLREYKEAKANHTLGDRVCPEPPASPVEPKPDQLGNIDWEYFKEHIIDATPIQGILDLFTSIASNHKVVIITGRSDRHRPETIEWLKKVIIEKGGNDLYRRINFQLIMREDKEMNLSGAVYKRNRVTELAKQYNIQLVIEDCPEIIEEYNKMGLLVLVPTLEYYKVGTNNE